MTSIEDHVNVPFFRKKAKGRPTAARKRSLSPTGSPSTSQLSSSKSEVVLPTKRGTTNLLSAGTKRTTSQRDQLDNDDGASRKEGPDVKWTAAGSHTTAALDIIAGDEIEEILAKRRKKEREDTGLDDQDVPDDGNYHGQAAYKHHVKKTAEPSKAMRAGPQRSTNTIRTVTIIDYQPDVCKDYKGMDIYLFIASFLEVNQSLPSKQKRGTVASVTHVNSSTTVGPVSCPS